ncbi:hypothetical protein [Nocardioides stalactiti]|uniref:hypothetical protein n=1 Tax=Nocardioides stalactiti TaxID=2755356 RepID=UPI001604338F|nr:hypothetical protein [Nocardioides stalactiti]
MRAVESRTRLEQLQTLERRVRHEIDSATRAGNRRELARLLTLEQKITDAIRGEGGRPLPKRTGAPRTRRKKAEDRVTKRLQQLGVTSHDVKVWAVSVGLLDQVRRGRIKGAVVEAYATAHQQLGGAA